MSFDDLKLVHRFEGDTGLIVRVQENLVVLLSDLTMHELKVLPKDLQLCTDMATGVDSLGQFQFGDMVQVQNELIVFQPFVTMKSKNGCIAFHGGMICMSNPQVALVIDR